MLLEKALDAHFLDRVTMKEIKRHFMSELTRLFKQERNPRTNYNSYENLSTD